MIDRRELEIAKIEIREHVMRGEHYLSTGLMLGVVPTEDDIEKAARDLLMKRAEAKQRGEVYGKRD